MNHYNHHTAILLFARSASYETNRKNFKSGLSLKKNAEISQKLFEAAHNKCLSAGIPVYHIDESKQKGSNFADRLRDSFSQVFERGFEHVIAVGNDCPSLTVNDIINTQKSLEKGNCVLGSTQKGGVYIIGVSKNQFQRVSFEEIEWGTPKVFKQIYGQVARHFDILILKTKKELNRISDILISHFGELNELIKCLISLASERHQNDQDIFQYSFIRYRSKNRFRGPPR